jgi:hypothetical protein
VLRSQESILDGAIEESEERVRCSLCSVQTLQQPNRDRSSSSDATTMKVFISHITEEASLALALKRFIERKFREVSVFASSDVGDLTPGDQWLEKLHAELRECRVLLLMCSRSSLVRPWIHFEAGCAWIRATKVIPVCHSGQRNDQLPYPFRLFQGVQLEDEHGLPSVLATLAKLLGVKTPPVRPKEVQIILAARPLAPGPEPAPQVIRSRIERTRLITNDLVTLLHSTTVATETVWSSAFLSTLSIGQNDPYPLDEQPHLTQLLAERDVLLALARKGCRLRFFISPANENHIRRSSINFGILRTEQLLAFLKSDEPALAAIDWVVSEFETKNLYIIGHLSCFEGYKKGGLHGYELTLRQTSRDVIDANIDFYDGVFEDLSTHTLTHWTPRSRGYYTDRRDALRAGAIECLATSLRFLQESASSQSDGDGRRASRPPDA